MRSNIILLFLFIVHLNVGGQVPRNSFDLSIGYPRIVSDVKSDLGICYNFGYNWYATSHLSFRPFFTSGKANGSKFEGLIKYQNQFIHSGATMNLNLAPITGIRELTPKWNIWLQIGAGALGNNLSLNYDTNVAKSAKLDPIDFDQWVYAFTLGLSGHYYLSPNIDLLAGLNINLTQTRYLTGYQKSPITGSFRNDVMETFYLGIIIKPYASTEKQMVAWKHITIAALLDKDNPDLEKVLFADDDKDGIPNQLDQDLNTPLGVRVDSKGIAIDTDYDGLPDYLDNCPLQKGVKENKGCPKEELPTLDEIKNELKRDSDDDGVMDLMDQDNATPVGVKVDPKGNPLDTDNDGVPDYKDNCPLIPGLIDKNGCPK